MAIRAAIEDRWARPEGARNHMVVTVGLALDDRYAVSEIVVAKSSGVEEFDASALKAVRSASPFIELGGLDQEAFERNFRRFTLQFEPEDLRR
jgi:colicin import membrane protein